MVCSYTPPWTHRSGLQHQCSNPMLPWIKSAGIETTKAHRNQELPPNVGISYSVLESEVNSLRGAGWKNHKPRGKPSSKHGLLEWFWSMLQRNTGAAVWAVKTTFKQYNVTFFTNILKSLRKLREVSYCNRLSSSKQRFAERLNNAILNNSVLENTGF